MESQVGHEGEKLGHRSPTLLGGSQSGLCEHKHTLVWIQGLQTLLVSWLQPGTKPISSKSDFFKLSRLCSSSPLWSVEWALLLEDADKLLEPAAVPFTFQSRRL